MGQFGVRLGNDLDTISRFPDYLVLGNINEQGLGYYGGKIMLSSDLENGKYLVSLDNMDPACMKVNKAPLNFATYKTVIEVKNGMLEAELTYTRQNCFGIIALFPIHLKESRTKPLIN